MHGNDRFEETVQHLGWIDFIETAGAGTEHLHGLD